MLMDCLSRLPLGSNCNENPKPGNFAALSQWRGKCTAPTTHPLSYLQLSGFIYQTSYENTAVYFTSTNLWAGFSFTSLCRPKPRVHTHCWSSLEQVHSPALEPGFNGTPPNSIGTETVFVSFPFQFNHQKTFCGQATGGCCGTWDHIGEELPCLWFSGGQPNCCQLISFSFRVTDYTPNPGQLNHPVGHKMPGVHK